MPRLWTGDITANTAASHVAQSGDAVDRSSAGAATTAGRGGTGDPRTTASRASHPSPALASSRQHRRETCANTPARKTMKVASSPKDPFRTGRQLPRTPLSEKNGNNGDPHVRPKARVQDAPAVESATKIPRSSHARSRSPLRTPRQRTAAENRPCSDAAPDATAVVVGTGEGLEPAKANDNADVSKGKIPHDSTPGQTANQCELTKEEAEQEFLAAFRKTPKMARTPPEGRSTGADKDSLKSARLTNTRLFTSSPSTAPVGKVQSPTAVRGASEAEHANTCRHESSNTAAAREQTSSEEAAHGPTTSPPKPDARRITAASAQPRRASPASPNHKHDNLPCTEAARAIGYGLAAPKILGGHVARATAGKQVIPPDQTLGASTGLTAPMGLTSAVSSASSPSLDEKLVFPSGTGPDPLLRKENATSRSEDDSPRQAPKNRVAVSTAKETRGVERREKAGAFAAAAAAAAATAAAGLGSSTETATYDQVIRGDDVRRAESVAILQEGAAPGVDATSVAAEGAGAGALVGKLTPAILKGLAAGMRTPSTAGAGRMSRLAESNNRVPPMRSLDPPDTRPGSTHPPPARGRAPKATPGVHASGLRFGSSSVQEAAAAAAAAAATAAAAAKRTAAVTARESDAPATEGHEQRRRSSRSRDSAKSLLPSPHVPRATAPVEDISRGASPAGCASEPSSAPEGSDKAVCPSDESVAPGAILQRLPPRAPIPPVAVQCADGAGSRALAPLVTVRTECQVTSQQEARDAGDNGEQGTIISLPGNGIPRSDNRSAYAADIKGVDASPARRAGKPPPTRRPEGEDYDDEAAGDPFASRSQLPRTPVQEADPGDAAGGGSTTLAGEGEQAIGESVDGRGCEGQGRGGSEGAGARKLELVEIGELQREVACMADRLAKQTDERSRLAEVAFQAQDEAADLRKQLDDLRRQQQQQQQQTDELAAAAAAAAGGGGAAAAAATAAAAGGATAAYARDDNGKTQTDGDRLQLLDGEAGSRDPYRQRPSPAAMAAGNASSGRSRENAARGDRLIELEVERWECETQKQNAEQETRKAEAALAEAQAKVRELSAREEDRREKRLEENWRRAQAKCKQTEKTIDEIQLKVKLLVANARAELLRSSVLEQEKKSVEQGLRAATVDMARKACGVLEAFGARNKRAAGRAAGLKTCVQIHEGHVARLEERSALLEAEGRSAAEEAKEVKVQLEAAKAQLEAAASEAQKLRGRLGPLEEQHREARTAQENLRSLLAVEEARRISLEERLSEVRDMGEEIAGLERARRQSTQRRLGLAERSRDELATAAARDAVAALRVAVQDEKERRLSAERRLEEAERARGELSASVLLSASAAPEITTYEPDRLVAEGSGRKAVFKRDTSAAAAEDDKRVAEGGESGSGLGAEDACNSAGASSVRGVAKTTKAKAAKRARKAGAVGRGQAKARSGSQQSATGDGAGEPSAAAFGVTSASIAQQMPNTLPDTHHHAADVPVEGVCEEAPLTGRGRATPTAPGKDATLSDDPGVEESVEPRGDGGGAANEPRPVTAVGAVRDERACSRGTAIVSEQPSSGTPGHDYVSSPPTCTRSSAAQKATGGGRDGAVASGEKVNAVGPKAEARRRKKQRSAPCADSLAEAAPAFEKRALRRTRRVDYREASVADDSPLTTLRRAQRQPSLPLPPMHGTEDDECLQRPAEVIVTDADAPEASQKPAAALSSGAMAAVDLKSALTARLDAEDMTERRRASRGKDKRNDLGEQEKEQAEDDGSKRRRRTVTGGRRAAAKAAVSLKQQLQDDEVDDEFGQYSKTSKLRRCEDVRGVQSGDGAAGGWKGSATGSSVLTSDDRHPGKGGAGAIDMLASVEGDQEGAGAAKLAAGAATQAPDKDSSVGGNSGSAAQVSTSGVAKPDRQGSSAGRERSRSQAAKGTPHEVSGGPNFDATGDEATPPPAPPTPPPKKRARKLLGGGASRCKTPKAKREPAGTATTSGAASNAAAASTAGPLSVPGALSSDSSATVATGTAAAGSRPGAAGGGVGPKSGRAQKRPAESSMSTEASTAGAGGGPEVLRSVSGSQKQGNKALNHSSASILAMRGRPPVRGSLFRGFLDPRNGFKVPKLKPGAARP